MSGAASRWNSLWRTFVSREPPPAARTRTIAQTDDDEPAYRPIDRKLVQRLLTCLWPFRRRYAFGIALGVVMISLEMTGPLFVRAIVNWGTGYVSGTLAPMPSESDAIRHVFALVALWASVF